MPIACIHESDSENSNNNDNHIFFRRSQRIFAENELPLRSYDLSNNLQCDTAHTQRKLSRLFD